MSHRPTDEELRHWLRAGDPLPPDEELPRPAALRMRQVVLAAEPRPAWPMWRVAAVAASLAVALAAAWLTQTQSAPGPDATLIVVQTPPAAEAAIEPPGRQIQFVTRGGTRVIWTLKPRAPSGTEAGDNLDS